MNRLSAVGFHDGKQVEVIFVGTLYDIKTSLRDAKLNLQLNVGKKYEFYGLDLSKASDMQRFEPESHILSDDEYGDTVFIEIPMDFLRGVYVSFENL